MPESALQTVLGKISRLKHTAQNRLTDSAIDVSARPVFVVGCGHTGTTLMASVLARHDGFHFVPYESRIFHHSNARNDIADFFAPLFIQAQARRVLEKTPRHVEYLGRIFRLFPMAQVIVMMRDGRDVACSIRRRKGTLESGIERWLQSCRAIAPWSSDARLRVVRYEDFVVNPVETVADILRFLGEDGVPSDLIDSDEEVEWHGSRLKFEAASAPGEHLLRRKSQINSPLYDDRERWREELSDDERKWILCIAGSELRHWGYGNDSG